ncbi:MAG TPA: class I SAM-dependent methyltransferase [Rhodoferax sp.]|nr:class I SAM-dependent methyltransferase [Rhodoferax sp.]HPW29562.1 class I SAM-dependent methyltransferase [Rhodoferax sp.]
MKWPSTEQINGHESFQCNNMNLLEHIASERSPSRALLAKLWRRYALRALSASDNHVGLQKLYALPDPWDMRSAREQSRFLQTNALIEGLLGRPGSVLEIGCGEGHQSIHLMSLCDRLDGIDVSERAVERARMRAPLGRFGQGEVSTLPWLQPAGMRYDLVIACEVLYYMSDIDATLHAMSQKGHACLVTFFGPSARLVAPHLVNLPGLQRGWIYHDPYAWLWAFWRP